MSQETKKIKLDDEYYIECDAYNYHLRYEKVGEINQKTGKPTVSTDDWHFSQLSHALNRYVNQALKTSESVLELQESIKRLEGIIKTIK